MAGHSTLACEALEEESRKCLMWKHQHLPMEGNRIMRADWRTDMPGHWQESFIFIYNNGWGIRIMQYTFNNHGTCPYTCEGMGRDLTTLGSTIHELSEPPWKEARVQPHLATAYHHKCYCYNIFSMEFESYTPFLFRYEGTSFVFFKWWML